MPKNLCVDTRINLLGAFKKKVMSRIFHASVAAILDFCTLYCFEFINLLPKNLDIDTKINILGAFL